MIFPGYAYREKFENIMRDQRNEWMINGGTVEVPKRIWGEKLKKVQKWRSMMKWKAKLLCIFETFNGTVANVYDRWDIFFYGRMTQFFKLERSCIYNSFTEVCIVLGPLKISNLRVCFGDWTLEWSVCICMDKIPCRWQPQEMILMALQIR